MNDNNFYLSLGNGISKIYSNDTDGALKAFSEAIKSESNNPFDKRYAIAFHLRGNIYSQMGNYAGGIADRKKAMEIDPEYEKFYNNLGNKFAEIDRNAIDNISISIGDNFKKVLSELSNAQNTLEWIKDHLQNETHVRNRMGRKSIGLKEDEESVKILIKNIIETEFRNKVKKGETVIGGIRSKILDILSNRHKITIDDQ
jgi:tetratricopeptide (TPR) repeat protein